MKMLETLLQRKYASVKAVGEDKKCTNCEYKLQRKESIANQSNEVPPSVHEVLASAGEPLDAQTRAFMEPRFGHDFGSVRIHADAVASLSAGLVNADAYTVGSHVVFRDRSSAFRNPASNHLLAHELCHVIQQNFNDTTHSGQLTIDDPNSQSEREAEQLAQSVFQGTHGNVVNLLTGSSRIQRYVSPLDALDYIGLAWDVAEAIYLSEFYHGNDKELRQILNLIITAIDLIMAATPGAGGGGLAMRASSGSAALVWRAMPKSAQLSVAEQVAKQMGWSIGKATQLIAAMMSSSSAGSGAGHPPESGSSKESGAKEKADRSGTSDQEQRAGWVQQAREWFKSSGIKSSGKVDGKTGKTVFTNNAKGRDRRYYTIDQKHGEIEMFNARKEHVGSLDLEGQLSKEAVAGRYLEF